MFRASLCPSSGEQVCALPHMVFCTGCDGCGCVELGRELCTLWKLLFEQYRASLCPSSGEQECALPHVVFCTGCDGCGCVELGRELCALWKLLFEQFRASLCPSSGEQECTLPHTVFLHWLWWLWLCGAGTRAVCTVKVTVRTVSGIIIPIIRRTKVYTAACGVLHCNKRGTKP